MSPGDELVALVQDGDATPVELERVPLHTGSSGMRSSRSFLTATLHVASRSLSCFMPSPFWHELVSTAHDDDAARVEQERVLLHAGPFRRELDTTVPDGEAARLELEHDLLMLSQTDIISPQPSVAATLRA